VHSSSQWAHRRMADLNPDFEGIRERLKQPVIIDDRNMHVPRDDVGEVGFEYISIGRP
jgi:hypothetical protein